jgi:hypothetical protein
MAQRKYIGFILAIYAPCFSFSNPWILEKGKTKITFDFETHFAHVLHKKAAESHRKIEQKINLLYDRISDIDSRIYQEKSQKEIAENIRRLSAFKNHRIREILQYISDLKTLQSYLYYNHKHYFTGTEIEYSLKDYLSLGVRGNFSKLKFSNDSRYGIFAKYNIYKKKGRILTLRNYFEFGNDIDLLEIDILFGKSKLVKFKKKSPKSRIVKEFFNYSSLGFTKSLKSKYFPTKRVGYRLENTSGIRLKHNVLLLYQKTNYIDSNLDNLYSNILKTQYKIAKEYSSNNSKITFSIGYFTDYSLVIKSQLSSGYNFGIWMEI